MLHLLIVDDDPAITVLVTHALKIPGDFQISCAHSGNEGLELVQRLNPDLIILDHIMPGLKGTEVVQRLRSVGNTVSILMLTSMLPEDVGKEEEREILCLKIGCDDFMFKVFLAVKLVPTWQ